MLDTPEQRRGAWFALAAYGFWGLAPLYFKAVGHVAADDILAHRIVWSVLLLGVVLSLTRAWGKVAALCRDRRAMAWLLTSALLIGVNWGTFILAVISDRMLEASLGYYINPLVSTCLGVLLLGEQLNARRWVAVVLAAIGTAWLAWGSGGLPVISLVLALTFAAYGLVRKLAQVEALTGLFVETALLAPLALGWLWFLADAGRGAFLSMGPGTDLLLVSAGIVTTLPMLWFVGAARRLPLGLLGFFQYLAPTLQFLLAVLVFGEAFDQVRLVSFAFIWSAVALYVYDTLRVADGSRRARGQGQR